MGYGWGDFGLDAITGGGYSLNKNVIGGAGDATGVSDYLRNTFSAPPSQYADRNQIMGYVNQGMASGNQAAPQLDATQQGQFRNMQMQQAQQLQRIASGQAQGAGELAVQRQVQNAQAAQQANARMARGGNAALAYRQAANNAAGIGLSGAGQSQIAALQDQSAAQNALTGALGSGRGQDLSLAGQNANLTQQQYGLDTQRQLGYLSQLTGMDANQLQAQINAHNAQQQMVGGLITAGGQMAGAAAMSDERVKKNIADAGDEIDEMLDKLAAKSYEYKDPKHGVGRRAGIMAQDLERSRAGARVVTEVRDGKAIDLNRAVSAALASAARLNARLRELERKAA